MVWSGRCEEREATGSTWWLAVYAIGMTDGRRPAFGSGLLLGIVGTVQRSGRGWISQAKVEQRRFHPPETDSIERKVCSCIRRNRYMLDTQNIVVHLRTFFQQLPLLIPQGTLG